MRRLFYSVLLVLGYLNCLPVTSQFVDSPCPGTFEYRSDGSGVYGLIHLQPNGPITSIHIIANFTIATRLSSNYVGRLEPISTSALQQQQLYQNTPIDYRVQFPVTSPLPRLTNLIVNNNVLCYGPGDVPQPNMYVTTISLQHMLLLRGTQPGFNGVNQFKPAIPKPQDPSFNIIGSSPNSNTQVFTFNADNDRTGSWNAVPTLQRPEQQGPQSPPEYYEFTTSTRRPEPQLPPEYYEYTTSTRRPPPPPQPQTHFPSIPSRNPSSPSNFECGMVSGGNERVPLIYNGQSYARGDWPWVVAIFWSKDATLNFVCSGTLVSDRHVVTAAHCVHQRSTIMSIKDIVVRVGVYNLDRWGDDVIRKLASATIHESYNSSTLANDLSVFTFEESVEFNNNIRPACLWSGNIDLSTIVGDTGVVAGWGKSELGPGSKGEPRMVRIPVVSTAKCRSTNSKFHMLTNTNTLCAGDRNGAGPCLGDSGGGLYLLEGGRWRLRGVVSLSLRPENGDNTCNLNEYIIFTDAAQYLQWIKNIMRY